MSTAKPTNQKSDDQEAIRALQEENARLKSMLDTSAKPKQFIRTGATLDSNEVDIRNAVQPAAQAAAAGGIEIDTTPVYASDALAEEAFMRDELEIELMEPGNENDAQFVEVNVNGDYRLLLRDGSTQKARRYHIAVLAQAKQSRVKQDKVVQPDGSMGFVEKNVLSLTYPFRIVMEPRGKKGADWLRGLLRTPA